MALALMVLGGLMVIPYLEYTSTGLGADRIVEQKAIVFYAADAGIEHALWKLKNDPPASYPYSYELTDLNGMSVAILIEELTTVYGVVLGSPGVHSDYLTVDRSMAYDPGLGTYVYTVTVSNESPSTIHIDALLVKPPVSFGYVSFSTGGDLTASDPEVKGEAATGVTLLWDFQTPLPSIRGASSAVHTFQLSGPPDYSGNSGNVWVVANPEDIGTVGDAGALRITANVRRGSTQVGIVRAGALTDSGTGTVLLTSWEVDPR
ncbi:MAG: hypothetical protein AB1603_03030 [Chloroflexota bacterium]